MSEQSVRYQFFKHYFNARQDEKLSLLQQEEGMEGVGIFWSLLEQLGPVSDHRAKCNYKNLAFLLHVSDIDKIKRVVEDYNLFKVEDGYFHSESFTAQMDELDARYQRRAAAGAKGGKRKAELKQISSNATAEQEQTTTNKRRGEKNKENNRDNISPSPKVEAESCLVASNEDDDATRHFDNRLSDKKYLEIIKAYMYRGSANPSSEANSLIDMFDPTWITKDGRSFVGREAEATAFWNVPRERKYNDGPRLTVGACKMVDLWIDLLTRAHIYDIKAIDMFRGCGYDTEKDTFHLCVVEKKCATYFERHHVQALAPVLRSLYGNNVQLQYNLPKEEEK